MLNSILDSLLLYVVFVPDGLIFCPTFIPGKQYFSLFYVYENYTNQLLHIKGDTKLRSEAQAVGYSLL